MGYHLLCKSSSESNEILLSTIMPGAVTLLKGLCFYHILLGWSFMGKLRFNEIRFACFSDNLQENQQQLSLIWNQNIHYLSHSWNQSSWVLFLSGCKSWVEIPDQLDKSQGNEVWKLMWKEFSEENMKTTHWRTDQAAYSKRKMIIRRERLRIKSICTFLLKF